MVDQSILVPKLITVLYKHENVIRNALQKPVGNRRKRGDAPALACAQFEIRLFVCIEDKVLGPLLINRPQEQIGQFSSAADLTIAAGVLADFRWAFAF